MAFVIAFDLDGTLIPNQKCVPTEQSFSGIWAIFFREPIRKGTKDLLRDLQRSGCEIWIYTTSFRSVPYIRRMFGLMGVRLAGVVNQSVHEERMRKVHGNRPGPSKSPSSFGIDLLVDDEPEIKNVALTYGFDALWIDPLDETWADNVIACVEKMRVRK